MVYKKELIQHKPRSEETAWRCREDGTYNDGPKSQTYHKEYYLKFAHKVECENCGSVVTAYELRRHQKSRKCEKLHRHNELIRNLNAFEENMFPTTA
jgi:methionyl-tRNA synthetase